VFTDGVLRKTLEPERVEMTGYGENCIIRSFLNHIHHSDDQTAEDKIGRICSTYGREVVQDFGGKS
jgi:hypothetical protein